MFDAIASFFKSLFAEPQRDELLVRVPVEEKKNTLYPRR